MNDSNVIRSKSIHLHLRGIPSGFDGWLEWTLGYASVSVFDIDVVTSWFVWDVFDCVSAITIILDLRCNITSSWWGNSNCNTK